MAPDEDDRPRLPFAVYLVVGILAVIGLFSIFSFVMSAVFWLIRALIMGAIAVVIVVVVKNIMVGRRGRSARTER